MPCNNCWCALMEASCWLLYNKALMSFVCERRRALIWRRLNGGQSPCARHFAGASAALKQGPSPLGREGSRDEAALYACRVARPG